MFWTDDTGAVTVDWVVLTAALVGLGLATMGVVSSGTEDVAGDIQGQMSGNYITFQARNFGKTPTEVALEVGMLHYSPGYPTNRMDYYLNDRTDTQLRNQYATWTARITDPEYAHPDAARDQVALIGIAMDARGVTP